MMMYLGLGGNQGDPAAAIRRALGLIETRGLGWVERVSGFYRTEPVGYTDQAWFVNAAAAVRAEAGLDDFHRGLRAIEAELGRAEARIKDGPRPIDLDILLWGDEVVRTDRLIIPHPRLHERAFVLVPLAEVAGEVTHPVLGRTIRDLRDALSDPARVEAME